MINKEKALRLSLKYLLVLSVFVPLVFYRHAFYPFVTTKAFAFRLLVEMSFVVFVVYFLYVKKLVFNKSLIWWLFLVLTGTILVAGFFGVNSYNSFWSNMERSEGGLFWIHLFVYFSLLVLIFKNKNDFKIVFQASLLAASWAILFGFMQNYGWFGAVTTSGARMSSVLGNAAYFGSYMLMSVFLAFYLLVSDKNIYWRIFYFIFIICGSTALFMTQTRGAFLGLVGGVFLTALLVIFGSKNRKIKMISSVAIVLIVVFISSIFIFKESKIVTQSPTLGRISSISTNDYTAKTRLLAWGVATQGFVEKPLLGWGPDNYNQLFSRHFPPEIYRTSESRIWFDKAHSVFFEYLATTGLVGIASYLGLLGLAVFVLVKTKELLPIQKNIFIGLLAGYTFANMFVFDTIATYILFALVMAFIANLGFKPDEKDIIKLNSSAVIIILVLLLVLGYVGIKSNYDASISNRKMLIAASYDAGGMKVEAYGAYLDALKDNDNFTRFEIRWQFNDFVIDSYQGFDDAGASEMFDMAITEVRKSIAEDPNNIKHYYNLSQLYLRSHRFDSSRLDELIAMGDKMIEIGPTRAQTYYQIGEAYFRKDDFENSIIQYQKAVDLNYWVVDTHINVYVVAVFAGNESLEKQAEARILELQPDYFEREEVLLKFIPMYKENNRIDRVISDLQKLIIINPMALEYHSSLAIVYAEMGENQKAEEAIRKFLDIDPNLEPQVNDFIEKLDLNYYLK